MMKIYYYAAELLLNDEVKLIKLYVSSIFTILNVYNQRISSLCKTLFSIDGMNSGIFSLFGSVL